MPDAVVEFSVPDPGTVQNVDTPEDYRQALALLPPRS
jgi:CTP:molybdopterin cytidylyltransferase MocA